MSELKEYEVTVTYFWDEGYGAEPQYDDVVYRIEARDEWDTLGIAQYEFKREVQPEISHFKFYGMVNLQVERVLR